MIVVDTSVWLDLFLDNEDRRRRAENVFASYTGTIYEPKAFKVELAGTLARRFNKKDVLAFLEEVLSKVELIGNPDELAYEIALKTGCRAIDAYFIATAKLTNSILITSDRIMAENAKKAGVEAYYLLEEFEEVRKRLQ